MHVEKKRIFIGNLPLNTNEAEIKKKFENYGEVLSVELKQRHESSRFAFVDLKIIPNKLNACFEGLHREWKGHITLELAKESFLSRLQRERQQQQQQQQQQPPQQQQQLQQQQTLYAAAAELSSGSSEDESPHKGRLDMFGGTKRALGEPLERKRAATESDMLHRLESFSDVWRDDRVPSQGSPWRKNQVKGSQAETSFKSLKRPELKADTTFKETATKKQHSLSEQRRLKSLDEKKRIFNEQKKFIQSALASVDSKQTLNKKIVFNSDDSDESQEPLCSVERQGAAQAALFDDGDSGDENIFTINRQFEGEKGQKLLELQGRYGNDERFKLDERFRDDKQSQVEQLSEQEEDERTQNLKILGSVLGHEIPLGDRKKHKNVSKPMLRFDPTKPDHVKYEIKKSTAPVTNGTAEKKKTAVEINSEQNVKVSKEKFYKVSESLKESFQTAGDGGSFSLLKMFGSHDDEKKEDSDYHVSPKEGSRSHNRGWSQNPFKYDSSDQEDGGSDSGKKTDQVPSLLQESSKSEVQFVQGNTFFFLPDDVRLREGVEFFNRKRTNVKKNDNFSEYRRNLKRFAKKKVKSNKRTVHKNRGTYSSHRKLKKSGTRVNHYNGLVSRRPSN